MKAKMICAACDQWVEYDHPDPEEGTFQYVDGDCFAGVVHVLVLEETTTRKREVRKGKVVKS